MLPKTKILLVDDCHELLSALSTFLEAKSYEVCAVISNELLQSAFSYFIPDVLILDIHLGGGLDGREICQIIKSNETTKHIPILLMSGYSEKLIDYQECNADAVIEKPFNLLTPFLKKVFSLFFIASLRFIFKEVLPKELPKHAI
ncbi:MAG: hypothetical protein NVS3B19_14940 [Ginsengibacter sp.]